MLLGATGRKKGEMAEGHGGGYASERCVERCNKRGVMNWLLAYHANLYEHALKFVRYGGKPCSSFN